MLTKGRHRNHHDCDAVNEFDVSRPSRLYVGQGGPDVLHLVRVLREFHDARPAVDSCDVDDKHHGLWLSARGAAVLNGGALVLRCTHESPLGEASAPPLVDLAELGGECAPAHAAE